MRASATAHAVSSFTRLTFLWTNRAGYCATHIYLGLSHIYWDAVRHVCPTAPHPRIDSQQRSGLCQSPTPLFITLSVHHPPPTTHHFEHCIPWAHRRSTYAPPRTSGSPLLLACPHRHRGQAQAQMAFTHRRRAPTTTRTSSRSHRSLRISPRLSSRSSIHQRHLHTHLPSLHTSWSTHALHEGIQSYHGT